MKKKLLFISGSIGLGHVARDFAITEELEKQNPDLEISWLASDLSREYILEKGGKLALGGENYNLKENMLAEKHANIHKLNVTTLGVKFMKHLDENFEVIKHVTSSTKYDLIVGDEAYELTSGYRKDPKLKTTPIIMIYDFVGFDTMTYNPLEWLSAFLINRVSAKGYFEYKKNNFRVTDQILFVGEREDVPDRKFGILNPNRREWADTFCMYVGYILGFKPEDYLDKKKVRKQLGYGDDPLIICSIGGTAVGKSLLELCGQAYPLMKKKVPNLRMVLVCGPRLPTESLNIPEGVDIRGFVPDLYEHFAACDLAIVQGGSNTNWELTALRRPFINFPLKNHFEQAFIAENLARRGAGIEMSYHKTTPEILAETALANLDKKVSYKPIPTDGAERAAKIIGEYLV